MDRRIFTDWLLTTHTIIVVLSCLDVPVLPAGAQRAPVWAPENANDRPIVRRHLTLAATAASKGERQPRDHHRG